MNREYSCKCVFTVICVCCTTAMVGYWFYKFGAEDRDIGVVDYELFEKMTDNPFPVITLCLSDIFVPKSFPEHSRQIDVHEYPYIINVMNIIYYTTAHV